MARVENLLLSNNELLVEDLRERFRQYLVVEYSHIENKNIILSDALYLHRHDIGFGFWEALRNKKLWNYVDKSWGSTLGM